MTAKGFTEKARLTAKYLARSLSFFRLAREDCSDLFRACKAKGIDRIMLVGAGDLCEIAALAGLDIGIEMVAVFDQATNREQVAGLRIVRDPDELARVDAVVITDMKDPQGAYDRMAAALGGDRVVFPSLLRLSTRRPAEVAAAQ